LCHETHHFWWVLVRVLVVVLNKKKVSSFKVQQAPEQAPTRNDRFHCIKVMILLCWRVLVATECHKADGSPILRQAYVNTYSLGSKPISLTTKRYPKPTITQLALLAMTQIEKEKVIPCRNYYTASDMTGRLLLFLRQPVSVTAEQAHFQSSKLSWIQQASV